MNLAVIRSRVYADIFVFFDSETEFSCWKFVERGSNVVQLWKGWSVQTLFTILDAELMACKYWK